MKRIAPFFVALVMLLLPSIAHADPHPDELFSIMGLELRGFGGVTGGFTNPCVVGGDVHLAFEGDPFGLHVGFRGGSNLGDTQFAIGDIGARVFVLPSHDLLYVGGGAFYGAEFTGGFGFSTGNIGGFFGEVGLEYPRKSTIRTVLSARVDFGFSAKATDSNIAPPPFAPMLSLNFGVFFGGKGTTLSPPPPPPPPEP